MHYHWQPRQLAHLPLLDAVVEPPARRALFLVPPPDAETEDDRERRRGVKSSSSGSLARFVPLLRDAAALVGLPGSVPRPSLGYSEVIGVVMK